MKCKIATTNNYGLLKYYMQLYAENLYRLMNQLKLILMAICLLYATIADAQSSSTKEETSSSTKKKSSTAAKSMFNFDLLGIVDFPMADMAERFGTSYRLGLGIKFKTNTNWIFGIKGELITGSNIREDSLMYNLKTSAGGVISQLGEVLNVGTFERGYTLGVQVGRIFPVLQANANSGPTTIFSTGFIQHKIKLFDRDNSFPQLRDSYVKGYDRLTNGIYLENFTGYTFYSTNKLINVYAGLNMMWGFTQGRRTYLYDVARSDNTKRNDILLGFKVGWVVPIYKKVTEETYY